MQHRRYSLVQSLDPELADRATALLRDLVASGAALGWVEPPPAPEVLALLAEVSRDAARADAALAVAQAGDRLAGLGYWRGTPGRPTACTPTSRRSRSTRACRAAASGGGS